jgi:ATPase subunit of ABC transporter with duplicated ATPase domains
VDLTVAPGDRLGVVGPNGVGKSTLLAALAGLVPLDSGRVDLAPPTATVGLLPQEPDRRPGETLMAFLARRTGVADASAALDAASDALAAGVERDEAGQRREQCRLTDAVRPDDAQPVAGGDGEVH